MTREAQPELDPELEEWLAQAREAEDGPSDVDLDGMLGDVEGQIERAEGSWTFWLESRPTWLRRAVAIAAAVAVVGVGGAMVVRPDIAEQPVAFMAVALGSMGVLLGASLYFALRPLHQPPLPRWLRGVLIGATLASTCALALFAPHEVPEQSAGLLEHVSPCLFYGLLAGLPVYGLLRLLDRGGATVALLGACAAGLTANLALQLHCPRNDLEHLMAAHFAVVLLFVGGLGVVHWLIERARDR